MLRYSSILAFSTLPRSSRGQCIRVTPEPITSNVHDLVAAVSSTGNEVSEIERYMPLKPAFEPSPYNSSLDPLLSVQQKYEESIQPDVATIEELQTFPGIPFQGVVPPDTVGDIGQDHFVQMTNSASGSTVLIMNKVDGSVYAGPFPLRDLAPIAGSNCKTRTKGDPIVLYDQYAQRWLITEFLDRGPTQTGPYGFCVYVLANDFSGGFLWEFQTAEFPDYPKYGVWRDAYYVGTNQNSGPKVYAMERNAMLLGMPAGIIQDSLPRLNGFGFQMAPPVDADGNNLPPAGSSGIFVRHVDDEVHGSATPNPTADFVELWSMDVDFSSCTSTLAKNQSIPVSDFSSELCGLSRFDCVPQPGTHMKLDPLREPIMHRPQYRNFGSYEVIVLSWVTDVGDFVDHHGVRWTELRRDAGDWYLYQEGTYAPDDEHRFMSSIAMDGSGNIALEYSVSSDDTFPGIRFVARTPSDPPSTMTSTEQIIENGLASQTFSNRYGDYSSISVDPEDECTFWTTNEWIPMNGWWETKIASFRVSGCKDPSQAPSQTPSHEPSQTPSDTPSESPSQAPSQTPSHEPSQTPSDTPSRAPSHEPSQTPSDTPSESPSHAPSQAPSHKPSKTPSGAPSRAPSHEPSQSPSDTPLCESSPCQNGGTCTENERRALWLHQTNHKYETEGLDYTCQCPPRFTGTNCETEIFSPCDPNPCKNWGMCIDEGDDYFCCKCPPDYFGQTCESRRHSGSGGGHGTCHQLLPHSCHNPCYPYTKVHGLFYYEFCVGSAMADDSKFVQCDAHGGCFVQGCPHGTAWDQWALACNHRSNGHGYSGWWH